MGGRGSEGDPLRCFFHSEAPAFTRSSLPVRAPEAMCVKAEGGSSEAHLHFAGGPTFVILATFPGNPITVEFLCFPDRPSATRTACLQTKDKVALHCIEVRLLVHT